MENLPEQENVNSGSELEVKKPDNVFKKPVLIGKIGKLPKKLPAQVSSSSNISENIIDKNNHETSEENLELKSSKVLEQVPDYRQSENSVSLPYQEPSWSGLPEANGKDYVFEVLKNGSIIETINLMSKSFWVFGRLANCCVCMQHPTISRYHAVLQYRKEASDTDGTGFYIYDLGSTHGTFLNKNRLKPKIFVRMQVGHMLKLGCSTRSYILNGPESDTEEELQYSVTELKQKREQELLRREEEKLQIQKELEEKKKKEEERGIDWGLGEDADEETDLSENPFAQTNNEELYLDDPKKALRGFFEREGVNLEYHCNEQGIGQFLCRVELPLDDEMGRPIVAEVLHKGKKKEAVIQCALEACRILDRYGVLRQATHESRKRKAKNWEENDFYDSDEDTFLDRTGTIEKKREKRMNAKAPPKVETYESLMEKESTISKKILELETKLAALQDKRNRNENENSEEDSLECFMKGLTDNKMDKNDISSLKIELTQLRTEYAKVIRLINIVKPANMPAIVSTQESIPSTSKDTKAMSLPMFGKRKKIQIKYEDKSKHDIVSNDFDDENEEDSITKKTEVTQKDYKKKQKNGSTEEKTDEIKSTDLNKSNNSEENLPSTSQGAQENYSSSSSSSSPVVSDEEVTARSLPSLKNLHNDLTFKKFEGLLKKGLPSYAGKHQEKLEKILNNLKKLATSEDRMHVDWKMLSAKKKKVTKLISDMKSAEPDEKLEHRVSSELNRILIELNSMTEQKYKVLDKVKKMGNEIHNISEAIEKDFKEHNKEVVDNFEKKSESKGISSQMTNTKDKSAQSCDSTTYSEELQSSSNVSHRLSEKEEPKDTDNLDERKKRKSQKRIQQKQEKQEQQRQRGYEEDGSRENYSMWMPPNNQSGDGRTDLNDKFGY